MNFAEIMFFTNQVFHLGCLSYFWLLLILISLDQISASGFLKWDQLVGGQFGQNIQKLQGNYKINIFGTKQWGRHKGQANFLGSGGILCKSCSLVLVIRVFLIKKHITLLCSLLLNMKKQLCHMSAFLRLSVILTGLTC